MCVASLESTPDSLTQGCKVQECKQQVMSYKLLFLGTCVLFLNPCPINNFLPALPAFPIVVGGCGEKCKNLRNYILSVQVRVTLPVF